MAIRKATNLKTLALAGCALSAIAIAAPAVAQSSETYEFDIAQKELGVALTDYGIVTGKQVLFNDADVRGKTANVLDGVYTSSQAVELLLRDTGVEYRVDGNGTLLVGTEYVRTASLGEEETPESFRLVQLGQEDVVEDVELPAEDITDLDGDEDVITVTGTLIRGLAPESSPVLTFTREDIQISGAATAQDFIQTLPQNFGGGVNADTVGGLPNDALAGENVGFGSSINLRGLGSGSTLVLLNGHRLAPSSTIGSVADISMIPASAIERVEILADGASSIYGSDAVSGVVNFILVSDYEGFETSFRYGIGTQNRSAEEFRTNLTGGLSWDSGNALISYEYFNQDEIGVQDRSFSQNALPPGDLQPSQERHSILATITQDVTSELEVFADVTFSKRQSRRESRFALVGDLSLQEPETENLSVAAGGTWQVSDTWFLDLTGTYGKNDLENNFTQNSFTSSFRFASDIWTADAVLSGTVLELPGGPLKLALGGQYREEGFASTNLITDTVSREAQRDVLAAFGEVLIPVIAPDNAVPGVNRLEVNVSGRLDDYSDFGSTVNPKVGVLWSPVERLKVRGSYSTSFNPAPIGQPTNSGVVAWNSAFVFPLLGITPADPSLVDIVFLSLSGIDPNLAPEKSRAFTAGVDFEHQWNKHDMTLSVTRFDIDFDDRLGTTPIPDATFGSFGVPNQAFNDPSAFPEGIVIFNPTLAQINSILESADTILANTPPTTGDPLDAFLIERTNVTTNLSRSIVSGFDFSAAYSFESTIGRLQLGLDGTFLTEFEQQAASSTPIVSLLNTQFNPVDLRLRGRAGYSKDGLAANLFVNYVDGYRVDNTPGAASIGSWTTVDFNMSYDVPLLNDTIFRLSVINLLDQDPPSAPEVSGFQLTGYDPTNASPLGRFVAFEVTKRF